MSWSVSLTKIPAERVLTAIRDAKIDGELPPETAKEIEQQLDVAKAAALVMFTNEVVGIEGEFNIFLSGHAEPNHIRRPGYASDSVTVTVQRYYNYSEYGN